MHDYIKSFQADVANPAYFAKIKHKNTNMGSSLLLDDQDLEAVDIPSTSAGVHTPSTPSKAHLKINKIGYTL